MAKKANRVQGITAPRPVSAVCSSLSPSTLIDAAAVPDLYQGVSILVMETMIGAFALLMLGYIMYEHKKGDERI